MVDDGEREVDEVVEYWREEAQDEDGKEEEGVGCCCGIIRHLIEEMDASG